MAFLLEVEGDSRIYTAFSGEFSMTSLAAPKMAPAPPKDHPELLLYSGLPAIVQDFQYRAGGLQVLHVWTAPQDRRGMDRWRIFQNNENNLIAEIGDRDTRQFNVTMPGNSSAMFYICAVSKFGREGLKASLLAKTNSDLYVIAGTGGSTSGTQSPPDSTWANQRSGGNYRSKFDPL